jgi:hypothetical protein
MVGIAYLSRRWTAQLARAASAVAPQRENEQVGVGGGRESRMRHSDGSWALDHRERPTVQGAALGVFSPACCPGVGGWWSSVLLGRLVVGIVSVLRSVVLIRAESLPIASTIWATR